MQNFSHESTDPLFMLGRAILFRMDPEKAHDLTLSMLDSALARRLVSRRYRTGQTNVAALGMNFDNYVGLAAGMDKNGDYIDALGSMGFGHIEIGTVTPKPQAGNPKPRLFRLAQHQSLINRMGFNNKGVDHLVKQVASRTYAGKLGINIGKNASTPLIDAQKDYLYCLERVYPLADYVTVNISSPNTRDLRDLQHGEHLKSLLGALENACTKLSANHQKRVPLVIKIAPDMADEEVEEFCVQALAHKVDGIIIGNTSNQRAGVESHADAHQSGGLSGKVLLSLANNRLTSLAARLDGKIALFGVGGISCAQDATDKINLGADLVQVYSGLIYQGPALIRDCIQATNNIEKMP